MFLPVIRIVRTATLVLAVALIATQPASADFEAGQQAWDAGSIDEAVTQWQAAADEGDRRAMLALGRLYAKGLGVLQDPVEAHKWLNLAASRGEEAALPMRDALAVMMTPTELTEARQRAAAWLPGGGDGATTDADKQATAASTPSPSSKISFPPRLIREVQSLLTTLGYRPGPIDGIWGNKMTQAYRKFLQNAGLPVSDTLTPEALKTMRALAKKAAPTQGGSAQPPRQQESVSPAVLHRAAQVGDIEVLMAALASGVEVDARDGRGWTALMHAVNKGYPLLVEPLLAANASVNLRAPDGATALLMAVAFGYTEIVAMLMRAGAEVSIPGQKGETAVDVARLRYGQPEVAREQGLDAAVIALVEGRTWAEVAVAIDAAAWARAKEEGTTESYGVYVRANPEGRYVAEARRREAALRAAEADAAAWAWAKGEDTIEFYEVYARANPEGRYVAEARRREVALREQEERDQALIEAGRTSQKQSGLRFKDCVGCPELVVVPAGEFMMGSPKNEEPSSIEQPQHRVTIAKPFAVGVYEVTFDEWDACRRAGGCTHNPDDKGWGRENRPVITVSWDDAREYVRWLSGKTGQTYRLLSESEWEYAARAGAQTSYWWGDDIGSNQANCRGCGSSWDGKKTAPVSSFSANAFGLHDVHGNVREWVGDCWNSNYKGAPADGSVWGSGKCVRRVLRGGSWFKRSAVSPLRQPRREHRRPPERRCGFPRCQDNRLMNLSLFASCGDTGGLAPVEFFAGRCRHDTRTATIGEHTAPPNAHSRAQPTIRFTDTPWIKV